jgi:methylmalonyl-CoA mutase
METQYQRSKIQEESLYYETKKHSGELPIIGVNTFLNPNPPEEPELELTRATPEEKESQIRRLREFHERHKDVASDALARLKQVARENGNIFAELMETVKVASLGQITSALYEVGGQYRRNMRTLGKKKREPFFTNRQSRPEVNNGSITVCQRIRLPEGGGIRSPSDRRR